MKCRACVSSRSCRGRLERDPLDPWPGAQRTGESGRTRTASRRTPWQWTGCAPRPGHQAGEDRALSLAEPKEGPARRQVTFVDPKAPRELETFRARSAPRGGGCGTIQYRGARGRASTGKPPAAGCLLCHSLVAPLSFVLDRIRSRQGCRNRARHVLWRRHSGLPRRDSSTPARRTHCSPLPQVQTTFPSRSTARPRREPGADGLRACRRRG